VHRLAVDDPEDGVVLAPGGGREVQRHHRREGPIEQSRRQSVVLAEREPIPLRRPRRLLMRVLAEVAQEVAFNGRVVTLKAREARDVLVSMPRCTTRSEPRECVGRPGDVRPARSPTSCAALLFPSEPRAPSQAFRV
jgi:hypothetical protein